MGHKRYYRHDLREENGGTINTRTAYLGGLEKIYRSKVVDGSATTPELEYKFTVGNVVITERANAVDNTSTGESYLHKDHLGSPLTITDENGKVMQQHVYDPWGKVHQLAADSGLQSAIALTTRGYTGHEGIAGVDIIHMNGRIYDPTLGRFLQADPFIQYPNNSQSYNRYSYVLNNPLSYTDPSGYLSLNPFKVKSHYKHGLKVSGIWAAHKFTGKNPALHNIGITALNFVPVFGQALAALANFNHAYINSGSLGAAFRGAAINYVASYASANYGDSWQATAIKVAASRVNKSVNDGRYGNDFAVAGGTNVGGADNRYLTASTDDFFI